MSTYQQAYATSADVTYSVNNSGGTYTYTVNVYNSSPVPYDMYSFLFGYQFNVPMTTPFSLNNVHFVSSPAGWTPVLNTYGINYQTSWAGSSSSSGYVASGSTGTFVFTSTTAPPNSIPCGTGYYNNNGTWGFTTNCTATLNGTQTGTTQPSQQSSQNQSTQAQPQTNYTVTVSTDKSSYVLGDTIKISGTAYTITTNTVTLQIFDPSNKIVAIAQTTLQSSGSYSTQYGMASPSFYVNGIYTLKATYQGATAQTTFSVNNVKPTAPPPSQSCPAGTTLQNGQCVPVRQPPTSTSTLTYSDVPYITAVVADDSISGRAAGFAEGDTITVKFSENTNEPPAQTKSQIDTLFSFSQNLGANYSGKYLNPSTLVITIIDPRGATPPTVGVLTITVRNNGNLRNSDGTSPSSTATSPTLTGCFCPFSVNIPTKAGGTASTTLPSGVAVALTLPPGNSGTVTISKTQASSLKASDGISTLGVIGNVIDITLSNGASCVQSCAIEFTFTQEDLVSSKVNMADVRIFHDHNNDGDFKDPSETLPTTIVTDNTSGFFTAKARDFFNSRFMVGGIVRITLLAANGFDEYQLHATMSTTIIQGLSSDDSERVIMSVAPSAPTSDHPLSISLTFTDANGNKIQNQNYAISATQDGTNILNNATAHSNTGDDMQTTGLLVSPDPVDLQMILNGQGLQGTDPATWIGPKGDVITFHVVPEFSSLVTIVLAFGIIGMILTAKSQKLQ